MSAVEFVVLKFSQGLDFVVGRAWVDLALATVTSLLPGDMPDSTWRKAIYVMLLTMVVYGVQEGMKGLTNVTPSGMPQKDIDAILNADKSRTVLKP